MADRLAKALTVAGITGTNMAEYLGISLNTVSNYTNGRTVPKKQTLRLWALKTGAPLEWIETGIEPTENPRQSPDGNNDHLIRRSEVTEIAPIASLADFRNRKISA